MDALSDFLEPYTEDIGAVAGYLTIAQFFSGIFICLDIQKKGTTRGTSAVPFIGGIGVGIAMLKYGLILDDNIMLQVNVTAILLNSVYGIFYLWYSKDKWNDFLKPFFISMAGVIVLWAYSEWEDPEDIEFIYGMIVTILMLLLLGSPLLGVKKIVEEKDASSIPFVLTMMGALVTFSWLLYAFCMRNNFMIVQNVAGFILCIVQLVLICLYPGKPLKVTQKKKKL